MSYVMDASRVQKIHYGFAPTIPLEPSRFGAKLVPMTKSVHGRLRWFGALCLILAGGMLVWGLTLLRPYLTGLAFGVYWLVCMGFTGLAMLVALLDVRIIRQQAREQQVEMLNRLLGSSESAATPLEEAPGKTVGSSRSIAGSPTRRSVEERE